MSSLRSSTPGEFLIPELCEVDVAMSPSKSSLDLRSASNVIRKSSLLSKAKEEATEDPLSVEKDKDVRRVLVPRSEFTD